MSMNAWIIVGDQPTVGNLITVARSLGAVSYTHLTLPTIYSV